MSRLHVPLQIPGPGERLVANLALIAQLRLGPSNVHAVAAGLRLEMESHVLVEIAGITEGTQTELALERLEACVCAYVYLQAIFAGVDLAAVNAQMTLLRGAHIADYGLDLGGRVHRMRGQRCAHSHGGQVRGECARWRRLAGQRQ